MDLSTQETFIQSNGNVFVDKSKAFKLVNHPRTNFSTLWMYNEFYNNWIYCCRVDTLEELETEYNKRSNRLFEWKSPSKSRVSYSWLVT